MQRWMVNVCPFLHFDNSRIQTFEHNISIASWNIKSALDYLNIESEHKFCIDQVTLLEGFQRLFPNYWDELQKKVLDGQLELVGGTYVMPDFIIPDGESIVRQFLIGMNYFRKEFGIDVKTGWAIDSAGHCSQLPQILRLCGIDSFFFWRGMPYDAPTEFVWKGPDGSRVNAIWLPMGYEVAAWLSENAREAFSNLLGIIEESSQRSVSSNLFIPVGGELVPPPPHLADLVHKWNMTFQDTRLVITTPREYIDKIKSVQAEFPVIAGPLIAGRFAGIRSGGLSGRIRLKLLNRELEGLLYMIEVFRSILGEKNNGTSIENIWRILLFNQDHNIIRGTCADAPYQLAVKRFNQGKERAKQMLDETIRKLTRKIATVNECLSIAVFNPLNWERTDVVETVIDLSKIDSEFFAIKDTEGNDMVYQINGINDETGSADIVFVARDLPPLGYKVFSVVPVERQPEFESQIRSGKNWLESRIFSIEFEDFSGSISRILDKTGQFEVLSDLGNYITIENDVGDLYRYSRSELSTPESDLTSERVSGKLEVIEEGPVRGVMRVTREMGGMAIEQEIMVYDSITRIDMTLGVDFKGRSKRMRLNFPLTVFNDHVKVGAQFIAESRSTRSQELYSWEDPAEGAFSALDWVLCESPDFAICISAPGLHEFEFTDGKLRATLLRSVDHLSRGLDDDVVETKTSRETGRLFYRYMISTFKDSPEDSEVWRRASEHRLPLLHRVIDETDRSMPVQYSLVSVRGGEVMITCVKPTTNEKEYIFRLFEMNGETSCIDIEFSQDIESVKLVDLTEREIGDLVFEKNSAQIALDPHAIATLKIQFKKQ